jgi:hypothetical protein
MIADDIELLPPPDEEELLAPPDEPSIVDETPRLTFDEPAPEIVPAVRELVTTPLVELLPADFPLPTLIKFIPDPRIRAAADADAARVLEMQVTDEGSMRAMDAALERQRNHYKTIEALFEEPTTIAHRLHKRLTGHRGEWLAQSDSAIRAGGQRIVETQRRLDREAADERRRRQEEADRFTREQLQREADAARAAQAPPEVVAELETEAKTATAPPVTAHESSKAALKSTSVVSTWKPRPKGTESSGNHQPCMTDLTPAQKVHVLTAMKAAFEGRSPLQVFEINWTYLNARARADKNAFSIEGFEVYEDGGTRGKGRR